MKFGVIPRKKLTSIIRVGLYGRNHYSVNRSQFNKTLLLFLVIAIFIFSDIVLKTGNNDFYRSINVKCPGT